MGCVSSNYLKTNGSLRFSVDYPKSNTTTERNSCPIFCLDKRNDSLGEAVVLSSMNDSGGFLQVGVEEPDHYETTFTSHGGLYGLVWMPFELKIAPGSFQRAMNVIVSFVKGQFALVYLNDTVVILCSLRDYTRCAKQSL